MHTVPIPIPMPIPISIPYQYHINVECFKTSPHQNIKSSTHSKLTLHRILKSITTTSLHPAHIVVESNSQSKHHIIPHAAALHQTLKANSTSSASSTLKMSNCHNIRHTASTRQALKASTRHGTQHTALLAKHQCYSDQTRPLIDAREAPTGQRQPEHRPNRQPDH